MWQLLLVNLVGHHSSVRLARMYLSDNTAARCLLLLLLWKPQAHLICVMHLMALALLQASCCNEAA